MYIRRRNLHRVVKFFFFSKIFYLGQSLAIELRTRLPAAHRFDGFFFVSQGTYIHVYELFFFFIMVNLSKTLHVQNGEPLPDRNLFFFFPSIFHLTNYI